MVDTSLQAYSSRGLRESLSRLSELLATRVGRRRISSCPSAVAVARFGSDLLRSRPSAMRPLLSRQYSGRDSYVSQLLDAHAQQSVRLAPALLELPVEEVLERCLEVPGSVPNHVLACYLFSGSRRPGYGDSLSPLDEKALLRCVKEKDVQLKLVQEALSGCWRGMSPALRRAALSSPSAVTRTVAEHCEVLQNTYAHPSPRVVKRLISMSEGTKEVYYALLSDYFSGGGEPGLDVFDQILYQAELLCP